VNTNPLRIIAMCTVHMEDGSIANASVGLDLDYDSDAAQIHESIINDVYSSLVNREYAVEDVVILNICNLGQVPMAEPIKEFSKYANFPWMKTCLACGEDHGNSGLPCPKMSPQS